MHTTRLIYRIDVRREGQWSEWSRLLYRELAEAYVDRLQRVDGNPMRIVPVHEHTLSWQ